MYAWEVSIYFTTVPDGKHGIIVTHQYNDVIIYGMDIANYLTNEFNMCIIRKLLTR